MSEHRNLSLAVWLAFALAWCAAGCAPSVDQKTLATSIEIAAKPTTITFPGPIRPSLPWSEILLETNLAPSGSANPLSVAVTAGLEVTLVERSGLEMPLQLSFANQYVEASAPALQWPSNEPPTLVSLRLRATRPIRFERVLWWSYDPSKEKAGARLPERASR